MSDERSIREAIELLLTIDRRLQRLEEKIDDLLSKEEN